MCFFFTNPTRDIPFQHVMTVRLHGRASFGGTRRTARVVRTVSSHFSSTSPPSTVSSRAGKHCGFQPPFVTTRPFPYFRKITVSEEIAEGSRMSQIPHAIASLCSVAVFGNSSARRWLCGFKFCCMIVKNIITF